MKDDKYVLVGGEIASGQAMPTDDPAFNTPKPKDYCLVADTATLFRSEPDYKYNEGQLLDEIRAYIDATYGEHYATDKYQATDVIIDSGHGEGFCIGNIMKYAKRYGKKNGYNRKDLLKIIHYAIIQLYVHDKEKK